MKDYLVSNITPGMIFPGVKRKGQRYFTLCPFHSEKNPSLSINPATGTWYCFGCGESGNYATFLIKTGQAADYGEAIVQLHRIAGLPLPQKVQKCLEKIAYWGARALKANRRAMRYLRDREITKESIEKYGIGYWGRTVNKLVLENRDEAEKAGLFSEKGNSLLTRRILFPVKTPTGNIGGYLGRYIGKPPEDVPPYLYSKFSKNEHLFGIHLYEVANSNRVYVVEGAMDAIQMTEFGFPSVSIMGSSISSAQADLLKGKHIVLVLDGDKAGRKGTIKSLEVLRQCGIDTLFDVSVAVLPEGEDPDSLIRKAPGRMAACIDEAVLGEVYLLRINNDEYLKKVFTGYLKEEKVCRVFWLLKNARTPDLAYNLFQRVLEEVKK